ncbi:YfhJ family protein [Alkalihalobacillus sp. MEB130]|uniref:YfhJ family protein n=1 Tax=Alkalihalobacillus sp. MEB130 TaxID=2976704 RepID=UPI0028E01080|nr:YfhJ family protein [Alkalihalobacillus sp. MEB130]MDT8860977.1 YfhJ family protein [Alkalihalobacillus sp. MEB130]
MEDRFQRLTDQLLAVNSEITASQARTWVESLWEDFETTRAKGGWSYKGQDQTESIVAKWIVQYGPSLHKYTPSKEKFSHLNKDDEMKH